MSTVVVLGGGTGGLVAARRLRRLLPRGHQVVLVDRGGSHLFAPSLLWLMAGLRRPEQLTRPLAPLQGKGIEVVAARATRLDIPGKKVETDRGPIPYDFLAVSLGAELVPEAIPGFAEGAHNLYTLEGAVKLRDTLRGFPGGRVAVVVSSTPFKCPAAPYEAALLIEHLLRERGVEGAVDVFTPEPLPMPTAGAEMGRAVVGILERRGICFHPGHRLTSVDPSTRTLHFGDGKSGTYDLLVGVPPHRCPQVLVEAGLAAPGGWVGADPRTLATKHPGVYAIGDCTGIRLPSGGNLPKAGVFAHAQAEVVARNIAAEIRGMAPSKTFNGWGACWLETGGGDAAFASGNFYAEPQPEIRLRPPGRFWHWTKVLFEKYWMRRWF